MTTRTRFAPSPTGYMHIGNLRTALYEYLIAKAAGGEFLLRIEDTDQKRYVEGATDIIYNTLKTVGMDWDEGPDIGGGYGPYVQSERKPIYAEYAHKLVELGGAHYCFCSKNEADEEKNEELNIKFKDPCKLLSLEEAKKRIAAGEPYVIRQTINKKGKSKYHDEVYGDIVIDYDELDEGVLLKSDGFPTYNFANVVDDHLMNITHVVRGNEYISSTPKYNLIYEDFGWEHPHYVHVPPVMKDAQHKLSKRNGDASFQDLVAKGYLPEAIINYIALLGWNPGTEQEIFSMQELIDNFSLERVSKSGARFQPDKAKWFNAQYMHHKSDAELAALYQPILREHGIEVSDELAGRAAGIMKERATFITDLWDLTSFFFVAPTQYDEKQAKKYWKGDNPAMLRELREVLAGIDDFSLENTERIVHGWIEQKGYSLGQVMNTLRLALVGAGKGPGMYDVTSFIGKEETLRRIDNLLRNLKPGE